MVRGATSVFSWWVPSHRNSAPRPSFPLWRVVTYSPLQIFVDIVFSLDQAQSTLCLTFFVLLRGREPFLPYSLVLAPMRSIRWHDPPAGADQRHSFPQRSQTSVFPLWSHENTSWFPQKYVAHLLANWPISCLDHVSLRRKLLSAVFTEFTWANMCISLETCCDGWKWLYFNKVRYLQGLQWPMCKSRGFYTSPLSIKELLLLMGHLTMFRDNLFGTTEEMLLTPSGNKPGLHLLLRHRMHTLPSAQSYLVLGYHVLDLRRKEGAWRDEPAVKSSFCLCRGLEFGFQHPHLAAHNCLQLLLQRI